MEEVKNELAGLALQVKEAEDIYLINLKKNKARRWRRREYNR